MRPFANPNDPRKDAVNRMIHKLLVLKDKALRDCVPMPKFTSHGNPEYISSETEAAELKKYANIKVISNLITSLENLVC